MTFLNLLHADVGHVSVDNLGCGSITIDPGPDTSVFEGSINSSDAGYLDAVRIRQDGDHLRITLPSRLLGSAQAHIRLGVPAGLSYDVNAGSADITVTAHIARSRFATGSGDVSVGVAADLVCTTGSGNVHVGELRGDAARLGTGSGDIEVGDAFCRVSVKSGSGSVVVRSLHEIEMQAASGSGDISVPATTGSLDLRSASGSLTVGIADGLPAWLDLNSASGLVRIALDASHEPAPGESYVAVRARTASGEIAVYRA